MGRLALYLVCWCIVKVSFLTRVCSVTNILFACPQRYYIHARFASDPDSGVGRAWKDVKVILSDASVPGNTILYVLILQTNLSLWL